MTKFGELTVNCKGQADILLHFEPAEVDLEFCDKCEPQLPSCEPIDEDLVYFEIRRVSHKHWALVIFWDVAQERKVKWHAKSFV